ncbi:hypothetical protein GCM10022254_71540 [Actinomadura meridiana]|uniref:Uncharacterized protein n=1 Tax=Actinomadura meridiana TaxID=559626 RepID=A0ABP8CPC2_9ACTN
MGGDRGSWTGPGGVRVTAVRLSGAHGVWARFVGIHGQSAFLVTRDGTFVGRGYYASVAELSEVVDLSTLRTE